MEKPDPRRPCVKPLTGLKTAMTDDRNPGKAFSDGE
jgi:hypothetical protein